MQIRSPWRRRAVAAGALALALPLVISAGVANAAPAAAPTVGPVQAVNLGPTQWGPDFNGAYVTAPPNINGQTWNFSVHSPKMGRDVPVQLLVPPGYNAAAGTPYPELYQLDGIEAKPTTTDWALKSDSQKFFADKNVLVVQPISGFASQYMNWQTDDPSILAQSQAFPGAPLGHLKWEDFLVDELPGLIGAAFHGNGSRAITGISTGAYAAFDFAANHPKFYKAAASYSGYPETQSFGLPQFLIYTESSKGKATDPNNLFGLPVGTGPDWTRNNVGTAANLTSLKDNGVSLYMSAGTGASGPFDKPSGFFGLSSSFDGSLIEFICNYSSQIFAREAAGAGVPVTTDLNNPGIHDWPYWNVQYKKSWPQLAQAIGVTGTSSTYGVTGAIAIKYQLTGGGNGVLGTPTGAEQAVAGGVVQDFHNNATNTNGAIYWSPATGAVEVHGAIGDKYVALGGPATSGLGFPITDETSTPVRNGKYNRFQNGYIYWTPGGTANSVRGAILDFWASQGYENSQFGFPTSEEIRNGNDVIQYFQGTNGQYARVHYIFGVGIVP